jgi:predicted transcriptional regulator of viral defense system
MGWQSDQSAWAVARRQHGVVTRGQLREIGLSDPAIDHRLETGRLHAVRRGVFAVGRPELGVYGHWMAAVLCCGSGAVLSHESAAALWEIRPRRRSEIEVSVPLGARRRHAGIVVHRRTRLDGSDLTQRHGIPVTSPACTLIDLAARLPQPQLERAINEADKRDLTDPEALRAALDSVVGTRPGLAILRRTLDCRTFALTESELERRFLGLAAARACRPGHRSPPERVHGRLPLAGPGPGR